MLPANLQEIELRCERFRVDHFDAGKALEVRTVESENPRNAKGHHYCDQARIVYFCAYDGVIPYEFAPASKRLDGVG